MAPNTDTPLPDRDTAGPHILAFQVALNKRGREMRLPLVAEDGFFGSQTFLAYQAIAWRMGAIDDPSGPLPVPEETLRVILDPDSRTDEQREIGWLRGRNLGPEVAGVHVTRGMGLLQLIGDWDSWISRRVDAFAFADGDEKVLVRKRSIDFLLPRVVTTVASGEPRTLDEPIPVPITFAHKWRLPRFDIRDENGCALPLMARKEYAPLSVGILIAMAYRALGADPPPASKPVIPAPLEDDLRAIVSEDPDSAISVYRTLGTTSKEAEEEVVLDGQLSEADWRRGLVRHEPFMELALEFAQGFLVLVMCPPPLDRRRILKISYEWPVELPARPRRSFSLRSRAESVRNSMRTWPWAIGDGDRPAAYGRLLLSAASSTLKLGSTQGPEAPVCVDVKLTAPTGATETFELRPHEVREIANLPLGHYRAKAVARPGFHVVAPVVRETEVTLNAPGRIAVEMQHRRVTEETARTSASMIPPTTRRRRISRALGWRSKLLLLRVRLADGGSHHLEFEAPSGLQVTRAKVVTDMRGELDIVLSSVQRAHLYIPAHWSDATGAFALVNLRTRPGTLLRAAVLTALFATLSIFAIAYRWYDVGTPGPHGVALLLAVPGALAAYLSRATSDEVTSELFFGLRMLTLVPGILAFAAAATILVSPRGDDCVPVAILTALGVAATIVLVMLFAALWQAMHPKEQRATKRDQSPRYADVGTKTVTGGLDHR